MVPAPAAGRALRGALASASPVSFCPRTVCGGPRRCPDVPPRLPRLPPVPGQGFCGVSLLSPWSLENALALGTPPVRLSHWRAHKSSCSATSSHLCLPRVCGPTERARPSLPWPEARATLLRRLAHSSRAEAGEGTPEQACRCPQGLAEDLPSGNQNRKVPWAASPVSWALGEGQRLPSGAWCVHETPSSTDGRKASVQTHGRDRVHGVREETPPRNLLIAYLPDRCRVSVPLDNSEAMFQVPLECSEKLTESWWTGKPFPSPGLRPPCLPGLAPGPAAQPGSAAPSGSHSTPRLRGWCHPPRPHDTGTSGPPAGSAHRRHSISGDLQSTPRLRPWGRYTITPKQAASAKPGRSKVSLVPRLKPATRGGEPGQGVFV